VGQLGRATWDGPGDQALFSSFSIRGDPAADRTRIDPEELGDFLGGISLQNSLDSQEATVFMFLGRSFVSHAREYTLT
jgi:hypothetical protein